MNIYGYNKYSVDDALYAFNAGFTVKCDGDNMEVVYGIREDEE